MLAACILSCAIAFSGAITSYSDEVRTDFSYGAEVRAKNLFLWASLDDPAYQPVGQNFSLDVIGAGLGGRFKLVDRVHGYIKGGYYWADYSADENIKDEVVHQTLVNRHGKPSWKAENFRYDIDNGWGGSFGISWQAMKHLEVFAEYRFLKLNESFDMCTGADVTCNYPVAKGDRHWQDHQTVDLSGGLTGLKVVF